MLNSRIAIATTDGATVAEHLARATAFILLDIADARIAARTSRTRDDTGCGNHKTFVDMLEGCHAVICGGIGQGAFDSLAAHGIESLVTAASQTIDDAAAHYLAGTLSTTDARVCLCH